MGERTAFITGITGQDGWFLTRWLLDRGYRVHGLARSEPHDPLPAEVTLHLADLTVDGNRLAHILAEAAPDEIYHLAAQSRVQRSFEHPLETAQVTALGTLRLFEAIQAWRSTRGQPVRVYHASSSEIFGNRRVGTADETTPIAPASPYGCAKAFAHWQAVNYRETHDLFVCNGILFNHESPRRPPTYVSRKITRAAARISLGLEQRLSLGDTRITRDWGYAGDYVRAMWLMLQQPQPNDYVIATGALHAITDWLDRAFAVVNLDWHDHVDRDDRLCRVSDITGLCGDATRARSELGWNPDVDFDRLVQMMVEYDLELADRERSGR